LITFTCQFNQLTTLPPLPHSLSMMICDVNHFETLPDLPHSLTYLSCSMNHLASLPPLPQGLERLYCSQNPLEALPELPSTLVGLACVLPHNDQLYVSNEMTPDIVQELNDVWMEPQRKDRCMKRCATYKEEIMMTVWHPRRVNPLIEMGIDLESVM
jgi:Leucine-rich repeat (LRR) protein